MTPALKKIYILCGILIAGIATVFIILARKDASERKLLDEKGVETEASVLEMIKIEGQRQRRSSYRNNNYFMRVAFFTEGANPKPIVKDTATSKAKNGSELVDAIFNKLEAENTFSGFGDYQTAKIPISVTMYQKYKVNDRVRIIYVKDDPSIIRLLGDVK